MTRFPAIAANRQPGLDFIGDVHGHADRLALLLRRLGYRSRGPAFRHPRRYTIFLGDILNRGPQIPEAMRIVRAMVDCGQATLILGNHEVFNLCHTRHQPHFRTATAWHKKLRKQCQTTLSAFQGKNGARLELMEWLFHQPLWVATPTYRAVHACWDARAIVRLGSNHLRLPDLDLATGPRFHALRQILDGPSLRMERGGGLPPVTVRVKWWNAQLPTWRKAAFSGRQDLADAGLPGLRRSMTHGYPGNLPPVFFGHYGFAKPAAPVAPNAACLDLAVAQGGPICAYRWQGERRLRVDSFVTSDGKP